MVAPQLLHFVVRDLTYTDIVTGMIVTCYTNNPCHLWLRYTTTPTQKHVKTKMVRGAPVGTYIDQCFVVFTDVEQNEPGDTYTHTFTLDPWPVCQTRWFYFWGTVDGQLSPSASAIFSKHHYSPPAPITIKIYSDPGTGLTTVDGFAQRTGISGTWAAVHGGVGTSAIAGTRFTNISVTGSRVWRKWDGIARTLMTFDLLPIPIGSSILSARYRARGYRKVDSFGYKPQLALYQSYPLANNNLVAVDYQHLYNVPLSNIIGFDGFVVEGLNDFNLTAGGLALLAPGQICKLGLREAKFDAPYIEPAWIRSKNMLFMIYAVDDANPAYRPYLEVVYMAP